MIGVAHQLELYVYDREGKHIPGATVTIQPRGSDDIHEADYDSVREFYYSDIAHIRFATVVVSCPGYEQEKRIVRLSSSHVRQVFILVHENEPYLYVGQGKTPYRPEPQAIGFIIKTEEPASQSARRVEGVSSTEKEQPAKHTTRVEAELQRNLAIELNVEEEGIEIRERPGTSPEMGHGSEIRHGIVRVREKAGSRKETLRKLEENPAVIAAGPIYKSIFEAPTSPVKIISNRIVVEIFPEVTEQELYALLHRERLVHVQSYTTFHSYQVRTEEPVEEEELNGIIEHLLASGLVVSAYVVIVGNEEEDIVPTEFLWPALWDRQLVGLHNNDGAWQFLNDNFPGQARRYGDASTIIAVVDSGVLSVPVGGVPTPQSLEFRGTVNSGITTTLNANAAAGSSSIFVVSTNNFAVGQVIAIGNLDPAPAFEEAVIQEIRANELVLTRPLATAHNMPRNVHVGGWKLYRYMDFNTLQPNNNTPNGHHGLWCAGVASARADNVDAAGNVIGVVGSAPNTVLMGMQFRTGSTQNDHWEMFLWIAGQNPRSARAFPAQLHRGSDVISCSIGFGSGAALLPGASAMLDRITRRGRYGRGCPTFFSAGNDTTPAPAGDGFDIQQFRPYGWHERIFSCAASTLNPTNDERRSRYSGYGLVEWCAPTSTTVPPAAFVYNPPNLYTTFSIAPNGTGDLPSFVSTTVALAAGGLAAGATVMNVNPAPGGVDFAVGRSVIIGNPGPTGWERVQITSVNSPTQFGITPTFNAYPGTVTQVFGGPNDSTTLFGGTSSATPLSAGIAALVLTAKPSLTWAEVGEIMRNTAVKIHVGSADMVVTSGIIRRWTDAYPSPQGSFIMDGTGNLVVWPFRSGASTRINLEVGTPANAGVAELPVLGTAGFVMNEHVLIGRGGPNPEVRRIVNVPNAATLFVDRLNNAQAYYARVERVMRTQLNTGGGNTVIGATSITVISSAGFGTGDAVAIGYGTGASEIRRVTSVTNGVTLAVAALGAAHPDSSTVDRVGTSLTAPNATTGPTVNITVHNTIGFEPGQAILIGNIGLAGSDISAVVRVVNANTLEVYRVPNVHPAGTLVIGGGVAVHSQAYGAGRLDAEAAVRAAFNYDHNHRDLMIRNHKSDDGITETDISVNKIHSPDIWIRNIAPNADGDRAFPLNYPQPATYDVDPPDQVPNLDGDRWIYARIKNRGTTLDSIYANVRFYLWRTNSTDPFVIPMDWQDDLPPAGLAASGTNPAIPSLAAGGSGPFFLEESLIFNTPRRDNLPPLVGGIPPGGHFIVNGRWDQTELPNRHVTPISSRLRTYILVEITPQDGVLAGRDIRRNNNITTREITLAQTIFRKNATDPLPKSIEVSRSGADHNQTFEVRLNDEIGYFRTEEITVEITKANVDGTYQVGTFVHNGTSWVLTPPLTGITVNAPVFVALGVDHPATGDQIDVVFRGSVTVNKTTDRVDVRLILKSHNKIVLSDITHTIIVTEIPVHYSGEDIVSSNRPRFNVFAEMSKLTQDATRSYGPKTTNRFRLTSGFTSTAADTKAFAVVTGTVFVQRVWNDTASAYESDVVNLILKPLRQSKIDFTPVKYFIYRGLRFSDFFNLVSPGDLRVQNAAGTSEFLDSFFAQHQARKNAAAAIPGSPAIADPPKSDALGWDDTVTAPLDEFLDKYFYSSDTAFQYPIVTRGMSLGTFNNTKEFGFEIVLEEGDFRPKLRFAQARFYEKIVGTGTVGHIQHEREEILNFVDPAAYYGMHYNGGVEDGGTIKKEATLYSDVIAKFDTANTVYIDIRNENGYSLNYYGNYGVTPVNQVKIGPNLSAGLVERQYEQSGWPIATHSMWAAATGATNPLFIAVRIADNKSPVVYVEHGDILTRSTGRFITDANLKGLDPAWTKEFGFNIPNTAAPLITTDKLYVSSIIKLHYSRRQDGATIWQARVVKTEKYLDNVFGPLDTAMFWQPGGATAVTKWISAQDKKFIDASAPGSNPFFAYMAERGIASEPPEVAGGTARVVFFASAISYLKDNPERVKNVRGIIGGYSSRGDLVESSRLFDGLDMAVTVIHDTPPGAGSPIEVRVPHLVSEAGSEVKPKDVLLLGISQDQYDALAAKGTADLSPNHQMNIYLTDEFSGTDPSTGAYKRYRLGVRGWSKISEINDTVYPATNIYVYTVDGCFFASSTFGTLQELAHYQPTPEELLADERTEPDDIIKLDTPMETLVNTFGSAVSAASIPNNPAAAVALETEIRLAAANILTRARAYAKTSYDDRQLYWARLQMTIRYQEHDYLQTNDSARRLLRRYFEEYSRGIDGPNAVNFGSASKKVLVIGFDPYMLSAGIDRKSPGGVAALALHGETITGGGLIQSIILPVRYSDFKDGWVDMELSGAPDTRGLIEEIIPKYLSGTTAAHAIVVLGDSAGRRGFEVERFAARARGGVADNNNDRELSPVGDGAGWNEFYEDITDIPALIGTLPTPVANQMYFYDQSYQSDTGSRAHPLDDSSVNLNTVISGNPTGISRQGSGGNYLFNEAFYRIAHLKANTTGSSTRIRLISLPAPENMVPPATMQDVVAKLKVLIERA